MFDELARRVGRFVARHDLLTIAVLVVLTVGVGAGLPQLDMEDQTAIDDEVFTKTDVGEALEYMDANYDDGDDQVAVSSVYVRPDGNALSRSTLLGAFEYLKTVRSNGTVERELVAETPIRGPPTLVGQQLAGANASLATQRTAIESASEEELEAAIAATFSDPVLAGRFLPGSYDPGDTEAQSMRLQFEFQQAGVTQQQEPLPDRGAQRVLYETAADRPAVFTMGTIAQESWDETQIQDVFWLIVPPALLLVVAVLAVAYRDPVDVILGFVGVTVSLIWFFGWLGWLGIPAGFASIVGPVLIVALSIDFGLHVFMRYREQREMGSDPRSGNDPPKPERADRGMRAAIRRSTASVMVAFLLVAVTAAVGFLANVTSPIGFIRAFGVVITLGVLSAVLVFVTLVPALKVRVDTTLERHGIDRRKAALGTTGRLQPALRSGVELARRAGVVVVVLAVVVGGLGLVAYTSLDRQGFQQDFADEGDWQTDLPDPVGWSAHETEYRQHLDYVQANYQSDDDRARTTSVLVRGDVTAVTALERVHAGTQRADDSALTFQQGDRTPAVSPLSLLRTATTESDAVAATVAGVAAENDRFADLVARIADEDPAFGAAIERADPADVDGDLTHVYDALYGSAPADARSVLEREDGSYESMRLIIPVEQGVDVDERGEEMHALADHVAGDTDLQVVPVGFATVANAGLGEIADSILWTMVLAFAGVGIVLAASYHVERGSATLGLVTVVPILVVVGLVFGGMYLFGVSLTFITAFLVSITIGLGIDYNIHVSDRFAQELDRGHSPVEALSTTVTGTGGALLGSALTSCAAFATLLVHPSPTFQSFGLIVVLALVLSFSVSILVFPSLLLWWARARRHESYRTRASNLLDDVGTDD